MCIRDRAGEDVIALDYNDHLNRVYVVILGTGTVGGVPVNQKQILAVLPGNPPAMGWVSWNGPDYGWLWNLDAVDATGY